LHEIEIEAAAGPSRGESGGATLEIPALRQTSPIAVPSSACRRMKAICASENFDRFIVLSPSNGPNRCAAKLEFSSNNRSKNREAGQSARRTTGSASTRAAVPTGPGVSRGSWEAVQVLNVRSILLDGEGIITDQGGLAIFDLLPIPTQERRTAAPSGTRQQDRHRPNTSDK
jgi:hypothetical protein